ncbi:hypothetical protein FVB32_03565 [Flagellimonas hymeniacidonis]|uniref:Uncharacterized protein n=1 Tax=Flagellimonas hymeniacidonis TaxID=2603628 RepID=A0A5C8V6P8_9FLAO|nr:hypothetical protein [Flagellimonas hymeniacidonis]TXN37377.1 hypothetical protein FVB32_03565 [Flagellimonas hymeniacidonis]
MGNSRLTTRILMEMENLITRSNTRENITSRCKDLHRSILRKHYNAADVEIDYNRHRIKMDVVLDDAQYDPKTINMVVSTLPVNLFYKDLSVFLKSCLLKDVKSLAFYASLLKQYTDRDVSMMAL